MSFPINLNYNSAIWDVITNVDVSSDENPSVTTNYHLLTKSDLGGWRYGYYYGIELEPIQSAGCGNVEQDDNDIAYYYKLRFTMPDGAAHDLFLYNQLESIAYGFYVWSPITGASTCSGTLSGPLTYYTADGSYIKLVMN